MPQKERGRKRIQMNFNSLFIFLNFISLGRIKTRPAMKHRYKIVEIAQLLSLERHGSIIYLFICHF